MEIKAYEHKVQYYETDQMGVVHHSNYIRWFEEARVDFLDKIGLSYEKMEKKGYISPVISISCEYKTMCRFGDKVRIFLKLKNFSGVRFTFSYEISDVVTNELRVIGESGHCFIDRAGKVISLKKENPEFFEIFSSYVGKEME